MSINSTLKNEGITVLGKLNTMEINKIAANISEKISSAFPEHNIDQKNLFISIARLDMYVAEMPNDMAMAKYFYKNNSIYFSKDMNLDDLNTLAIHECIHFIQEVKNKYGKLERLGLYNLKGTSNNGMALNEAAVQHMASVATNSPMDSVKYYNMEFSTESPDFYPLQTALINELIYFTGTYPLYHSTLYSNDIFKNTLIAKTSLKTYNEIENNFDLIFQYESMLSEETYKLSTCSGNSNKSLKISNKINKIKQLILEKTIETQNTILFNCFNSDFNFIRTLDDIESFQYKLYNFRNILINTENYDFYNDFYSSMMSRLEEKKEFILKYGNILTLDSLTNNLSYIEEQSYGFRFFQNLFHKLQILIDSTFRQKEY